MGSRVFLALSLAALVLSGCARDRMQGGSGRFAVDLVTDAALTEVTRADMPGLVAPDEGEFSLSVTRGGSNGTEVWSGDFADYPNEELPLDTGNYTATVLCGDIDAEGFGLPCFSATESFTITDGETTSATLTARLVNMAVTVDYTDTFKSYFTDHSATILRSDDEIAHFEKGEEGMAFLRPEAFDVRVDYTYPYNGVAERKGYTIYNVTEHVGAATLLRVRFDVEGGSEGAGDIGITVTFNDVEQVTLDPIDVGATK